MAMLEMILKFFSDLLGFFIKKDPKPEFPAPTKPSEPIKQEAPKPEELVLANTDEALDLALSITGKFEGTGFNQVTGDSDQQGLSVGILQWCFGQGSLQEKIIQKYIDKHGSIDALNIFPTKIDHLGKAPIKTALTFCRQTMLVGTRVKPEWKSAWVTFLTRGDVIEIQKENAMSAASSAVKIIKNFSYRLNSTKSFCFFFDIVVQNGSMEKTTYMSPDVKEAQGELKYIPHNDVSGLYDFMKNQTLWRSLLPAASPESVSLLRMAIHRAKQSRSEYMLDVINRKGSIAMGEGYVHGSLHKFNFAPKKLG